MQQDLSLIEPELYDLLITAMIMIGGEENKDYFIYEIDDETYPIIDWLHWN